MGAGIHVGRAPVRKRRARHVPRFDTNDKARATAGMLKMYKHAGVAAKRRRLPRQLPPKSLEREYGKALRALIARVRVLVGPLLAELPGLIDAALRERTDSTRLDAGEGKRVRDLMAAVRDRLNTVIPTSEIESLAQQFARQTGTYQRAQLGKQMKAALGVDVYMPDTRVRSLMEAFTDANVSLIRDVTGELAAGIEKTTLNAIQNGTLHKDLAKQLEDEFGYSERRAALIARDQVGKYYGQINAARQRSVGVTRFVWRTVKDERVRPDHEDRDGEIYDYSDPPDGELPGEPIQCRCYAEPVLDDILELTDEENAAVDAE